MRKRLKKEARVRRRQRRSRMTFLSTLAHYLRKWLAPKRLLEVSQAGRQAVRIVVESPAGCAASLSSCISLSRSRAKGNVP